MSENTPTLEGTSFLQGEQFDSSYQEKQRQALDRIKVISITEQPLSEGKWNAIPLKSESGSTIAIVYKVADDGDLTATKAMMGPRIWEYYLIDVGSSEKKAIPFHELWQEEDDFQVHASKFPITALFRTSEGNRLLLSVSKPGTFLRSIMQKEIKAGNIHAQEKDIDALDVFVRTIAPFHEYAHHLQFKPEAVGVESGKLLSVILGNIGMTNKLFVKLASRISPKFAEQLVNANRAQSEIERNAEAFTLSAIRRCSKLGFDLMGFLGGSERVRELIQLRLEVARTQSVSGNHPFTNTERRKVREGEENNV